MVLVLFVVSVIVFDDELHRGSRSWFSPIDPIDAEIEQAR